MKPGTVVVIGAGVGGLTAAALLVKAGLDVTVLEAHVYPGGSAGTFTHKGYRFDAGATLAGGFSTGGPHGRLAELLGLTWPVKPVDPAWVVHLPGLSVTQWAGAEAWREERRAAFPRGESFWRKQEQLAEAAWQVSTRPFPWPPVIMRDWLALARAIRPEMLAAAPYALRPVASLIPREAGGNLRAFVDAQLLISAQATAGEANALYGSAALDLPRRGVNAVRGGIGSLARTLADWITQNGGKVLYRQQVERIVVRGGRAVEVQTKKGLALPCDLLAANVTPWGLARLLGEDAPGQIRREVRQRRPTWGAFMLYLGVPGHILPPGFADHHQMIVDPRKPLGEGNSIFLSISDADDPTRAPEGMRAVTISTHTRVEAWWQEAEGYDRRREAYMERVLDAAELLVPGLRRTAQLVLPGTPRTFAFYTRRPLGMVGGFPQTSLLRARSPRTGVENIWLVGDSVFPGQSTAGVTLGAFRTAADMLSTARGVRFAV